ncbi:hypothetical protein PIB30_085975, partial [Stylosanthes scabra]|nr:hypothetical protein [Stylosanthes scabra]
ATKTSKSSILILRLRRLCVNSGNNPCFFSRLTEILLKKFLKRVVIIWLKQEAGNQRRTLADFTNPTTVSRGSSIVWPTVEANNFELKPALVQLVQQNLLEDKQGELQKEAWKARKQRKQKKAEQTGSKTEHSHLGATTHA